MKRCVRYNSVKIRLLLFSLRGSPSGVESRRKGMIFINRGVQSRQRGHGNSIQNPTKYTWCMMISLSVKVLFPILGAYCGGSGPPQ